MIFLFQDIPDDVFDLYCWIHSTYTIPRALSLHVGRDVAHPGVMTSAHDQEDERRYVTYYQWVGFTLFFQVNLYPSSSFLPPKPSFTVPLWVKSTCRIVHNSTPCNPVAVYNCFLMVGLVAAQAEQLLDFKFKLDRKQLIQC